MTFSPSSSAAGLAGPGSDLMGAFLPGEFPPGHAAISADVGTGTAPAPASPGVGALGMGAPGNGCPWGGCSWGRSSWGGSSQGWVLPGMGAPEPAGGLSAALSYIHLQFRFTEPEAKHAISMLPWLFNKMNRANYLLAEPVVSGAGLN